VFAHYVVTSHLNRYFNEYGLDNVYLPSPEHSRYINQDVLKRYIPVGGVRIEDDILVSRSYLLEGRSNPFIDYGRRAGQPNYGPERRRSDKNYPRTLLKAVEVDAVGNLPLKPVHPEFALHFLMH
jgi:hypothetical protein